MNIPLSSIIAKPFYELHKDIKQEKYLEYMLSGGRGSTKSSFAGIEIILGMMRDAQNGVHSNCVAMRKVGLYLKDSVHEQLLWAIDILGVSNLWDSKTSPQSITYIPTGQKIIFRGADKPKKIKSIKFSKGYCKYIWFEELEEFTGMNEIRMINQSLMRGGDKFVVFYSYNPPQSVNSWVNIESQLTKPNRKVHHSDYTGVPREWLGENFIQEAEYLKQSNLKLYEHEYLGIVTGTGGEVFTNVTLRPIEKTEIESFTSENRGLDYGFAVDPLAYNTMHYDRKYKKLYVYHEISKTGLSNRAAVELIKLENKRNGYINADSAEPKSIHEMNQLGLKVIGVKKGPDSVEYGVKFLQDLNEIIIDDTVCPETAKEFLNYEYERDANGKFKALFPDKDNHHIDAIRYGLNIEIMQHKELKKEEDKFDKKKTAINAFGTGKQANKLTKWG